MAEIKYELNKCVSEGEAKYRTGAYTDCLRKGECADKRSFGNGFFCRQALNEGIAKDAPAKK